MGLVSGTCKALLQLSNKNSPIKSLAKDMKRRFSKEDVQMASQHMKRASTSLVIRKMQVKTTMRYHFTPSRMAIMKRKIITSLGRGCGETEALVHCWWECKLVQLLWKTLWRFLKKLKIELPYDPAIPLLDVYPKELKTGP